MQDKIIRWVRPYLVRNGRPTYIVRELLRTPHGRVLVAAMFQFYVKNCEHTNYDDWSPDLVDIETKKVHTDPVDALRKRGL